MGRARPDRRLLVSAVVLAAIVAYALLVPWLAGVDDRLTNFADARLAPTTDHWFGTDNAGRDLFRPGGGRPAGVTVHRRGVRGRLHCAGHRDRCGCRNFRRLDRSDRDAGGRRRQRAPPLLLGIVIVALFRGSLPAIIASIR